MLKHHWPALMLLLGTAALAAESGKPVDLGTTEYGSVYLLETREEQVKPWQVGLEYGADLNNPYLNVSGVSVSAARQLSRHFAAGLQVSRFFASENAVTQAVQGALATDGITQTVLRPSYSGYATFTAIPLLGQLNLFSYATLPFDLGLTIGAGASRFDGDRVRPALLWMVSPQLMVTQSFGARVSLGQEVDSPFSGESEARLQARFGAIMRF